MHTGSIAIRYSAYPRAKSNCEPRRIPPWSLGSQYEPRRVSIRAPNVRACHCETKGADHTRTNPKCCTRDLDLRRSPPGWSGASKWHV